MPILGPQAAATDKILPSSPLSPKEQVRVCLQTFLPHGWWHMSQVGLICPIASVVGAGSQHCGNTQLFQQESHLWGCNMASEFWVRLDESQGKTDHFMEEKHILPARSHPPPSLKATSKTGHRDGTEEHALNRARWEDASLCRRHTQSCFVARSHAVKFILPVVLGSVSSPFPTRTGVVSTLAGGGQRLVDGGLEAAHVLHRGTVCFHRLHVLVQDGKNLVVQDLILPDPVGHLFQGLEGRRGRKTVSEENFMSSDQTEVLVPLPCC